jgi:hypothetical protein
VCASRFQIATRLCKQRTSLHSPAIVANLPRRCSRTGGHAQRWASPAVQAQKHEITLMSTTQFLPASDNKLGELAQCFTQQTGIKVTIDYMTNPQLPAKLTTAVQLQTGHDLFAAAHAPAYLLRAPACRPHRRGRAPGCTERRHIWLLRRSGSGEGPLAGILWCYGAKTVEADGKTVAINSRETQAAIEFVKQLYSDAMEPSVLV